MEIIRSLLYFFVRVLRFVMPKEQAPISPHPHIPALGAGKRDSKSHDICDWATSVLAFHLSPAAVDEWVITGIKWYKYRNGMEHEYPLFVIQCNSDPSIQLYLRFDRRPSPEALEAKKAEAVVDPETYQGLTEEQQKDVTKVVDQERRAILEKGINMIIRASKTSLGKDGGFEPDDTVMRTRNPHGLTQTDSGEVDLLATYSNFRHPFTLRDLAVISRAVVEESDAYLVLTEQCYWLTRTMVGISIAKYLPQPEGTFEETFCRAGRISRLPFVPPININNPTEIFTLVEKVNRLITKDDQRVQANYMDGKGGRIAAEALAMERQERVIAAEEALARERIESARLQAIAAEASAQDRERIHELERLLTLR